MWFLTSDHDLRVLYVVPQNSEIILGRNPDAEGKIFANVEDRSISRQHASLKFSNEGLFVQDLGSRYGTYINNSTDKLEVGQSTKLNENDVVKFGKLNWEWRVHKLILTTCTSTLKGENLQNVRIILQKLDGIVKSDWDDSCLYLTMPVITLTIKVVLALVQGSHIVTIEFWNKCLEAVNKYGKLPDPEHYTPEVVESTLNKEMVSFLPNQNRRVIFMNKKFIFFSKRQFEMYKQVLIKTSAEPLLLSESKLTKSMLCDDDVVVIQYNISNISQDTQAQRNQINDIISYLKSKEKRVVAESEIGLAILYCSTDKYCNPDFNLSNEVTKQIEKKTSNILAQESQESNTMYKKENIVINESLTSFETSTNSVKRKISEVTDDIETNANKKLAILTENTDIEGIHKRKFNEDDGSLDNPNKKLAMDQSVGESQDYFNFINPADSEIKQTEKKLNLSKPTKRKADVENDGDLFNFIELNDKPKKIPNNTVDTIKPLQNKGSDNVKNNDNISAMRGVKLQELMNKPNWESNVPFIKKEFNDLDQKMNELNLGSTLVTVRKDLIIKKEVIEIIEPSPQTRNFKKFKKVWPLKMQCTIVNKSLMSIVEDNNRSSVGNISNIEGK